ncbi:MAG: heparinase II/III family protein [Verrucomicrobia bacterium]|nr:heparinase II/III family protein [Verrucomicrobiota bacterium]
MTRLACLETGVAVALLVLTVGAANSAVTFPAQHPYLALTPQDIARARERVAQFGWAKQSLKNLVEEANKTVVKPFAKLPEKGDTAHWGISSRLFTAAVAAALTGERRYAEWVRDGLLAYADLYPTLPLTRGRCKVFSQSSLYEAMWLAPIAQAYDLVVESGALTDAQRRHIENNLLRAAVVCFKVDDYEHDPRISDLHYRCYNFQAWHLSAVGLVGLALRDAELVDWAVNSRYGFKHLIAHDIRDDGLFWERSVGYHQFVISALLPFTEGMMHCGVDLYHLDVPNDRSKSEGCHYVTDTSGKPKSLRLMFDPPFYIGFPDLSHIALGDSDREPLQANWTHLIAWHRYRDPKLAWLLQRDVPLAEADANRGRVGFLHYYRYAYRYEDVRLDGKRVNWDRRDPTFEMDGTAVVAKDGDTSPSDRYLLNDADIGDFTLEWTITRLADSGRQDRAWVVFHVPGGNPANRKSFALTSFLPETNRRYRFRLEVTDDKIRLLRDGQAVSSHPTVYRDGSNWRWLIYDAPQSAVRRLPLEDSFANTGIFKNGCSLFPSSGVAVLRQVAGDFTKQPDSTAVTLSYGPYGGGHGHPDKLSIAAYAQGRQWIPDFGSMPYGTHWKGEWTAQTISHNTVVVDGVSQKPTGARNVEWPVDNATNRVIGTLGRFDAQRKLVSASCDHAYDGFALKRTVQICANCVVDRFDVSPTPKHSRTSTHQFDYVLHIDGTLGESSVPLLPCSGPLGGKCGYQLVEQKKGAPVNGVTSLDFTSASKRLRVWIVPTDEKPAELFVAEGLTNLPDAKMPMLVLRRMGDSASFVTVIEPVDANPLRAVRVANKRLVLERSKGKESVPLR